MHVADPSTTGWLPLQHHDPNEPLPTRKRLGAARLLPGDGDNPQARFGPGWVEGALHLEESSPGARDYVEAWWLTGAGVVMEEGAAGPAEPPDPSSTKTRKGGGGGKSWRPIRSEGAVPDDRLGLFAPALPDWMPTTVWPTGWTALVSAGTDEDSQQTSLHPDPWGLIAVNAAGDPNAGTLVFDLDTEGRPDRHARLQSLVSVVELEADTCSLALQLGKGGRIDGGHGHNLWVDYDQDEIAFGDAAHGGPFLTGGARGCTKHALTPDVDGRIVRPLHLTTNTLFIGLEHDGRLGFEAEPYDLAATDLPRKTRAHLRFDDTSDQWLIESSCVFSAPPPFVDPRESLIGFLPSDYPLVPIVEAEPGLTVYPLGETALAFGETSETYGVTGGWIITADDEGVYITPVDDDGVYGDPINLTTGGSGNVYVTGPNLTGDGSSGDPVTLADDIDVASVTCDKLTVTGMIDPTGLEMTPQGANPGSTAGRPTLWAHTTDLQPRWSCTSTGLDERLAYNGLDEFRDNSTTSVPTAWAARHTLTSGTPADGIGVVAELQADRATAGTPETALSIFARWMDVSASEVTAALVTGGATPIGLALDEATAAVRVLTGADGLDLPDIGGVASTPPSGFGRFYVDGDEPFFVDDSGVATSLFGGGGATALDDLTDVSTAGVSDGDLLGYDAGSGLWYPVDSGSLGGVATVDSPLTGDGTSGDHIRFASQSAQTFLAGPNITPSSAAPTFRVIALPDLPSQSNPTRKFLAAASSAVPSYEALRTTDIPGGTDASSWQLDADASGNLLKTGSGYVAARNAADSDYVIVRADDPVGDDDLVTKRYADANVATYALGHSRICCKINQTTQSVDYDLPAAYLSTIGSGLRIRVEGVVRSGGTDTLSVTFPDSGGTPTDLFDLCGISYTWAADKNVCVEFHLDVVASDKLAVTYEFVDNGNPGTVDTTIGDGGTSTPAYATFDHTAINNIEASWGNASSVVRTLKVWFEGALTAGAVTEHGDTLGSPTPPAVNCPTLMVVRHRSATPGLFRLSAGTTLSSLVGTNTVSAVEGTAFTKAFGQRANDWVEFNGAEYFINTNGTSHDVFTRPIAGSTNTTAVLTRSTTSGATVFLRSGLHVVNTGSSQVLCFVFADTTTTVKLCYTTDGSSWTTSASLLTTTGTLAQFESAGAVVCRGNIYIPVVTSNTATMGLRVDVGGLTAAQISGPVASRAYRFATLQGRVFALTGSTNSAVQNTLYEVASDTLTSRLVMTTGGSTTTGTSGQHPVVAGCLFPIGELELMAFYPTNDGSGAYWTASKVTFASASDTAPTETVCGAASAGNSTVIPAVANANNGCGSTPYFFHCWTDSETDPGVPVTYVWWTNGVASAWTHGQYIDDSTVITGSASGVDPTNYALPAGHEGGGDRISPNDTTAVIEDDFTIAASANAGCMTVSGKAQIQTGTYTAKLWVSTSESPVYAECSLKAGSATGSGVGQSGTSITGITDGVAWGVDVDFTAMGIANTSRCKIKVVYYP